MNFQTSHRALFVASLLAIAAAGCGNNSAAPSSEPVSLVTVVQAGDGPIIRYARDYTAELRDTEIADLRLPMNAAWTPFHDAAVESTDELLSVRSQGRPAFVQLPIEADAVWYDRVEVEMRVTAGTQCLFKWATETAPDFARNPSVFEPINADGEFHTYIINLAHYTLAEWTGRLRAIEFWPNGETEGDAEIRRFRLLHAAHDTPRRVTIVNQTTEAVFGTQPPWRVRVPDEGLLSVYFGMLPDAARRYESDGVTFKIEAQRKDASPETLFEQTVTLAGGDHDWQHAVIGLTDYAGAEVDVHFQVDALGGPEGDFAFWGSPAIFSADPSGDTPPVILISLDTLRADHLSAYGYERETSPNIDRLAQDAVLFEHAIAAETWTLPSHMTIFTGLYPKNHGVTGNALLPESRLTLGDALSASGYLTAGFTGLDWWLMPFRGFAQGFDLYNHARPTSRHIYATMPLAMNWLQQHDTNRFFLFFHAFDIHSKVHSMDSFQLPYETGDSKMVHFSKGMTPPTFERPGLVTRATHYLQRGNEGKLTPTPEELKYMIAVYDDCIRMVDVKLGEFFDSLRERGLYDKALIVLLADHGESFFEHGKFLHQTVYEENCHVPLIVKLPKNKFAGKRIADQVVLADVLPTIADVLKIDTGSAEFDGHSVLPLIESGQAPHPLIYVQREEQRAVRTNAIKQVRYTDRPDQECYDLVHDPEEAAPNCEAVPEEVNKLFAQAHDAFFTVPSGGWHIAFVGGSEQWEVKITVSSPESRISNVAFVRADRRDDTLIERQNKSDYGFTATIRLERAEEEECIVSVEQARDTSGGGLAHLDEETAEMLRSIGYGDSEINAAIATGRLHLTLESNLPISVNGSETSSTRLSTVLDPSSGQFVARPERDGSDGEPRVFVWHSPPKGGGSPALSSDDTRRLGGFAIEN